MVQESSLAATALTADEQHGAVTRTWRIQDIFESPKLTAPAHQGGRPTPLSDSHIRGYVRIRVAVSRSRLDPEGLARPGETSLLSRRWNSQRPVGVRGVVARHLACLYEMAAQVGAGC